MYLQKTCRFSVLTDTKPKDDDDDDSPMSINADADATLLPKMELSRLLNSNNNDDAKMIRQELLDALKTHGFLILTLPRTSLPARIVSEMQDTLITDFFPDNNSHSNNQQQQPPFQGTGDVYISEKGVPMWKEGYEFCADDGVREAFRVAAGSPDGVPYPTPNSRLKWLRGLALCRHVCDKALQLSLLDNNDNQQQQKLRKRPTSGSSSWKKNASSSQPVPDRSGDYSVLYAMHYFNNNDGKTTPYKDGNVQINVKQHVDPSLFVLEPFLADEPGLQVFSQGKWITCDGPASPIHSVLQEHEMGMVLFVGKGFCANVPEVQQPTLHRVITAGGGRRTMIYEQKYEEFFPPPSFD